MKHLFFQRSRVRVGDQGAAVQEALRLRRAPLRGHQGLQACIFPISLILFCPWFCLSSNLVLIDSFPAHTLQQVKRIPSGRGDGGQPLQEQLERRVRGGRVATGAGQLGHAQREQQDGAGDQANLPGTTRNQKSDRAYKHFQENPNWCHP